MPPESAESPLHEPSALRLRGIILFVICFIAIAIFLHVLIWGVMVGFENVEAHRSPARTGVAPVDLFPPKPQIQPSPGNDVVPQIDLAQMHAAEFQEFQRRGWVDPHTQKVRVPEAIANQVIALSGGKPGSTTRESIPPAEAPPIAPMPKALPNQPATSPARIR